MFSYLIKLCFLFQNAAFSELITIIYYFSQTFINLAVQYLIVLIEKQII